MIPSIGFFVYFFFCAVVGFLGRNRTIGGVATFFLSLFFTPLLVALILLMSKPKEVND